MNTKHVYCGYYQMRLYARCYVNLTIVWIFSLKNYLYLIIELW